MRTDQQIVEQTNVLAALFYGSMGYKVPNGFRFDQATYPQARGVWNLACIAQKVLTDTDPDEALGNLEEGE